MAFCDGENNDGDGDGDDEHLHEHVFKDVSSI
jgi:hypothetical protein